MNRSTSFPYAMTSNMDAEIESLAYSLQLSKAGTIRRILRRAIVESYQNRQSSLNQSGALI
jgi:hypothetical protein